MQETDAVALITIVAFIIIGVIICIVEPDDFARSQNTYCTQQYNLYKDVIKCKNYNIDDFFKYEVRKEIN